MKYSLYKEIGSLFSLFILLISFNSSRLNILFFSFSFFLSFLEESKIPFILLIIFLTPSLILSLSLSDELILSFVLPFLEVKPS